MTHPNGPAGSGPAGGAGTGPGRLSDRALIRLFTALPVFLGLVLSASVFWEVIR